MSLSDEELTNSVLRSALWRQAREFKLNGDVQSQYLTELVRNCLEQFVHIPRQELTSKAEAVTHIIRQRMARKAAATRKKNAPRKKLARQQIALPF